MGIEVERRERGARAKPEPKPKDGAKARPGLAESLVEAIRLFRDNGLRAGLRAATADGQGSYMTAMFFFGIAALAFHYAILPQTSRESRLENTLSERQEALAGERFPVLAGLVIQPAIPLICDDASRDLRSNLEAIAAMFAREVDIEVAPNPDAAGAAQAVPPLQLEPACNVVTPNVGPVWTETESTISTLFMPSTEAARAELDCDPCAPSPTGEVCVAAAERRLLDDYGPVLRASLALDRLPERLPAVIHLPTADNKDSGEHGAPAGDHAPAGRGGPVWQRAAGQPARATPGDDAIRSVYFVSLDGITRSLDLGDDGTLHPPEPGVKRVDGYLPHFLNNGTSYFLETIARQGRNACDRHVRRHAAGAVGATSAPQSSPEPREPSPKPAPTATPRPAGDAGVPSLIGFVTAPYLDTFGGGLVETFCRAVTPNGKLLGAVCVDVAHSEKSVLDSLTRIDALDLSIVQIEDLDPRTLSRDGEERPLPDPPMNTCDGMAGICPPELSTSRIAPIDLKNFAALYYRNRLIPGALDLRRGGVFRSGCKERADSSECKFGVTVYRGTSDGRTYWDVAVIQLRRPQARDYVALIACGLGLGLGIAALTLGYRKKTRAREAYFVRGLALGAVHVAASDQVIGGNDRAEAIVGRDLPRMTIHDSRDEVDPSTFSSFIDRSRCVLIGADGQVGLDSIVSYDVVRWQCADKLTLAFYAHLHLRGWVRVTARVIVQPQQRDDLLFVIDTHVCDEHHEILSAIKRHPVPETRPQQLRTDLLRRELPFAIQDIMLSGKVTILYFCDELDLARFQRWNRSHKPAKAGIQIVAVTDRELVPPADARVVARAAVGDIYLAKVLPTAVLVDTNRIVREVAIGDDEIDRFVDVRIRGMARRIR